MGVKNITHEIYIYIYITQIYISQKISHISHMKTFPLMYQLLLKYKYKINLTIIYISRIKFFSPIYIMDNLKLRPDLLHFAGQKIEDNISILRKF